MKVTHDSTTDTSTIATKSDGKVAENDEDKPGVTLDCDEEGNLVSLDVLDASRRVTDARTMDFQTT